MYTKFGESMYVCSDINSLPIKDLRIADQIVLLQQVDPRSHCASEQAKCMVLANIEFGCIYTFECSVNIASFMERELYSSVPVEGEEDNEYLGTEKIDAVVETSTLSEMFLWVKEKNMFIHVPAKHSTSYMGKKDGHVHMQFYTIGEEDPHIYNAFKQKSLDAVYRRTTTYSSIHYEDFSSDNGAVAMLSIPLTSEAYLVFTSQIDFDIEHFRINTTHNVQVISNSGKLYSLSGIEQEKFLQSSMKFFGSLYSYPSDSLQKYADVYWVSQVSIKDAVRNNEIHKAERLLCELAATNIYIPTTKISNLFKPFYHNTETDTKAYAAWENFTSDLALTVSGKFESVYMYSSEESDLHRDNRKAGALLTFLKSGQSGIDPRTGELYEKGIRLEKDIKDLFVCSFGIRHYVSNHNYTVYYTECGGYFVPVTKNDKDVTERIEEQYNLMLKLMEESESHV